MRPTALRLSAAVLLVLTFISFILAAITLFAGHDAATLENYAVIKVNTSMAPKAVIELGINQLTGGAISLSTEAVVPRSSNWLESLSSELRDFFNDIEKNITSATTHGIDSFVDDAATQAKSRFNISDWYSLHVLSTCQGNYAPNATVSSPGRHTTSCNGDVSHRFNFAEILDKQFQIGKRNVSLGDLDWTGSIRNEVNGINDALYTLVILLSIAFGLLGVAVFSTAAAMVRPATTSLVLATLLATTLAGSIILGASVAVTVQGARSTRALNSRTGRFGVETSRGGPFLAIIWTLMALTTMVALGWQVLYVLVRRDARRAEIVKYSVKNRTSRQQEK
ncbi:hypothetical protein LLEC1_04488 [Akanthomyces lecanii]|uniref:Actin cortical patch SUR7/pH-response regulator PalI n=1 Tax=Cordyceps confragosa TaxID=2714763 RepID=A0A179IBI0_CORDF|nr:hypothetical protein LLEC1_04488 [Akanthomyces lecanii]